MPTAERVIDASEAQLLTAAVQLKVVTVRGKQMTLAVFRQVQQECVIDYADFSLRGALWGHVNYFPDDSRNATHWLHVLWQQGSELRRCYVKRRGLGCNDLPAAARGDELRKAAGDYNIQLKNGVWEYRGSYFGSDVANKLKNLELLNEHEQQWERERAAHDALFAREFANLTQLFIAV
jgi:hypothetical protein